MKIAVFYYMRLEDKYWVLFFAALVLLCALHEYGKLTDGYGDRLRRIGGYGLLSYMLLFSSFVYKIVATKFPWLQNYYELTHAVAMPLVIAVAVTAVAVVLHEEEKKRVLFLAAGFVIILCFAGDFAYFPSAQQNWNYDVSAEEKQVYDMMISHAKERGEETVSFWGMEELMYKSEFYHENLTPVYHKDIISGNPAYSEAVKQMYEGYRKYAEKKYDAERLREFSYAIAGLPRMYPQFDCDYVIVYQPRSRMEIPEDIQNPEGAVNFDEKQLVELFEEYGYCHVGSTADKVVFYKGNAE